jgi:hypothetical protein
LVNDSPPRTVELAIQSCPFAGDQPFDHAKGRKALELLFDIACLPTKFGGYVGVSELVDLATSNPAAQSKAKA